MQAFEKLKEKLLSAPIVTPPDWSLHFGILCDASDYAIGAVLSYRLNKNFHAIYYASKARSITKKNYTTTEKNY